MPSLWACACRSRRRCASAGGAVRAERGIRRRGGQPAPDIWPDLRRLGRHGVPGDRLLEIGSGTGFFLQQAQLEGYGVVTGIEPSRAAASLADPSIAEHIVQAAMKPGLFEPDAFDVVCLFQVFDHIPDPNRLLRECRTVLRPGGVILALNHNVDAFPNKSWASGARSSTSSTRTSTALRP